ncbi:MAG: hypothetical protein IJF68_01030, partial [Opitutales bacterium]|nr:hypothetical protein [Opitutales bacterium]
MELKFTDLVVLNAMIMIYAKNYARVAVGAFLFSAASAFAAVETATYGNFEVTYYGNGDVFNSSYYVKNDSTNEKYSGAKDWTSEMKSSVERSMNYWNSVITTNAKEKVKVAFIWEDLGAGTLGGAADVWYFDSASGITLSGAEAALRGNGTSYSGYVELSGSEKSAFVLLSKDANFYFGESEKEIKSEQHDFQSVLTHEIGHIMGFNTFCTSEAGWSYKWPLVTKSGKSTDNILGVTTFDSLLVTKNTSGENVEVMSQTVSSVFPDVKEYEIRDSYAPGKEYFLKTGENENGDLELSTLKIYNPETYSVGSSMGHVEYADSDGNGKDEPLMSYAIANGKIRRELNADELDLMRAMGWSVAIPEPSA